MKSNTFRATTFVIDTYTITARFKGFTVTETVYCIDVVLNSIPFQPQNIFQDHEWEFELEKPFFAPDLTMRWSSARLPNDAELVYIGGSNTGTTTDGEFTVEAEIKSGSGRISATAFSYTWVFNIGIGNFVFTKHRLGEEVIKTIGKTNWYGVRSPNFKLTVTKSISVTERYGVKISRGFSSQVGFSIMDIGFEAGQTFTATGEYDYTVSRINTEAAQWSVPQGFRLPGRVRAELVLKKETYQVKVARR